MKERILLWLFKRCVPKNLEGIDEEKLNEWLVSLQHAEGFRSYYKYRFAQITKTLLGGLSQEQYWQLVGRRKELLHLTGESKYRDDLQDRKEEKIQSHRDLSQVQKV